MERNGPLNARQLKVLGLVGGGDDFSGPSTMTVRLVAATHPTAALKRAAQLPPVPVPERLDQLHRVIARLRDDPERMGMPSEVRHRGLCILQRASGGY